MEKDKKKSRKIKGITYDPTKDKEIIDYIDKKPNISRYVLDLIREDMNKEASSLGINLNALKIMVKDILENDLIIMGQDNNKKSNEIDIDSIDLNSINNILNL